MTMKNLAHWWQILEILHCCSHKKKRAKQSHLLVYGDSWTFTCSSKTVH